MRFDEIKNIFDTITNPPEKLEFLMDLGRELEPAPDDAKCTSVSGCASRVDICEKNGLFYGRADSALVRGIVFVLITMTNEKIPNLRAEFYSLGLSLGAARMNGIDSILYVLGQR